MTRKIVLFSLLSVILSLSVVGCSKKSEDNVSSVTEVIATQDDDIVNAPASLLDSLALNADDLSPHQAVNLLNGYVEIYRNTHSSRTKAVTMRKFVDVYDILIGNYGDEFRNAVSEAANEEINLRDISQEFRSKLAGYDESSGLEYEPVVPKDSVLSSVADSIVVNGDN